MQRGSAVAREDADPRVGTQRRRKRLLLLAYACSPYRGSEPGTGWHRAVEAAKHFETWVICYEYKAEVERFLRERGEIPNLHFCFVPGVPFAIWLMTNLRPAGYLVYNLWHRRAYRLARQLHRELRFEVVHQANMAGFREPGYLWRLDPPFVWGPVGGTQQYPPRFLMHAGVRGALREGCRNLVNALQFRFSPRVRRAARKASQILAANPVAARDFARVYGVSSIPMLDVGVSSVADAGRRHNTSKRPLRLLWSGGLGHHKALHLLLEALAGVPEEVQYELLVLGSGPLERRWRRLAQRTGVDRHCTWLGWLPHDQALARYDWADLLVFTSLRDTFGSVVLEALSLGVPVICLDHQGAGAVVTQECGIKIPVTTPREVVSLLREAIVEVSGDRERLEHLSCGAIARAREYLWERHGARTAEIYKTVIASAAHSRSVLPGS